jgi:serine/threonine-protein kinase
MHVNNAPQPPSARTDRPLSPALERLLLRCLAKSPADRPQDAADLLALLEACAVPGRWTAGDAARWWADRDQRHSDVTQISAAGPEPGRGG